MSYAIRLTFTFKQMENVVKRICEQADVVVVYQHDESSRTHIHLYTEGMSTSVQTVKNWVMRDLACKVDKADWSFKTAKDRRFITYMAKGKLQPCLVKGISDAEINTLREKWVEPITIKKDKKVVATTWFMAKELAEVINAGAVKREVYRDKITNVSRHEWFEVPPETIIQECINIHNKHEKAYCDYSLVRVIQTAYGLCDRPKWKEYLVSTVYNKLFPQPRV